MSQMIKQVAIALVTAANKRGEYDKPANEWSENDFKNHGIWDDAIAAITAMRTPTPDMITRFHEAVQVWIEDENSMDADVWRAVIDQALVQKASTDDVQYLERTHLKRT